MSAPARAVPLIFTALLALPLVATSQAGGQASPPPCPANVVAQPTFDAVDLDEVKSSTLIATHTLQVQTNFDSAPPLSQPDQSSVTVSVPGATVEPRRGKLGDDLNPGPGGLTFFSDTAGSLPVNATWTQDDGTGTGQCSASASSTLQLQAPTPLPRLKNLLTHEVINLKYTRDWSYGANLGPSADHRPVEVRYRGVHKARLPGPKVPFKTLTLPLRFGDPGYGKQHHIALPRLSVQPEGDNSALSIRADSTVTSGSSKPLGYDIELIQAGRLLARFRLAGRCNAGICKMRPVKVHL